MLPKSGKHIVVSLVSFLVVQMLAIPPGDQHNAPRTPRLYNADDIEKRFEPTPLVECIQQCQAGIV
jgi:hypothetical protein